MERLRSHALEIFRERANIALHESGHALSYLATEFNELSDTAGRAALEYFAEAVRDSLLPPDICEWNFSMPLEELHTSIGSETDRMRKELATQVMAHAKDELEVNLRYSPIPNPFPCSCSPSFPLFTIYFLTERQFHAPCNKRPPTCGLSSANTSTPPWIRPSVHSNPALRPSPLHLYRPHPLFLLLLLAAPLPRSWSLMKLYEGTLCRFFPFHLLLLTCFKLFV